jgi:Na+/proline symporter
MGLGVGIFLIAVGAILAFAVNSTSGAVDIHTVGWILLAVGFAGVLLSLLFWQSWAGPGYWTSRRRTTYADDGPPAAPPY